MAWTNAWNEAAPAGSALRSTLDDIIRGLKLDIRERMNSLLDPTTPWEGATDPLILNAPLRQGVVKLIPCYALQPGADEDDIAYPDQYAQSDDSGTNTMRMGMPVEANWEITAVDVLFDLNTDTECVITLHRTEFDASPASSSIGAETVTGTGVGIQNVFAGAETTTDTTYYWLSFNGNDAGNWRAYAVRITYNEV